MNVLRRVARRRISLTATVVCTQVFKYRRAWRCVDPDRVGHYSPANIQHRRMQRRWYPVPAKGLALGAAPLRGIRAGNTLGWSWRGGGPLRTTAPQRAARSSRRGGMLDRLAKGWMVLWPVGRRS